MTSYQVRVSASAWDQVASASDWYADNAGLDIAVAFEEQFEEAASSLSTTPLRYPEIDFARARRVYVPGFPYALWYEVSDSDKEVVVLAISHARMSTETIARLLDA